MEPCLYINIIIFFITIKDLFNYLIDIFNNSYYKEHNIKKFQKLKIGASFFNNFYFNFIQLALNLKYITAIFI